MTDVDNLDEMVWCDANGAPLVVLMVSTCAKVARFVPIVRITLREMWPGHPPLRFLTDGGINGADVIVVEEREFVPAMAAGLNRIREEFPSATHVFHMLEDHCPLRRCNKAQINSAMKLAIDEALAAVQFVTYPWSPYFATELVDFGSKRLVKVPMDFFRYFQVQPGLWRISYFEKILEVSLKRGVRDPWNFEAQPSTVNDRPNRFAPAKLDQLPEAEQHYVSEYTWPTTHHGFLARGSVQHSAIDYADSSATKVLRQTLIKEALGVNSETLYCLYRLFCDLRTFAARTWGRFATAASIRSAQKFNSRSRNA